MRPLYIAVVALLLVCTCFTCCSHLRCHPPISLLSVVAVMVLLAVVVLVRCVRRNDWIYRGVGPTSGNLSRKRSNARVETRSMKRVSSIYEAFRKGTPNYVNKPLSGSFLKELYPLVNEVYAKTPYAVWYLQALDSNKSYWPMAPEFLKNSGSCYFDGTELTSLEQLRNGRFYVSRDRYLNDQTDENNVWDVTDGTDSIHITCKEREYTLRKTDAQPDAAAYFVFKDTDTAGLYVLNHQTGAPDFVQYGDSKYLNGYPSVTCMAFVWLADGIVMIVEKGQGTHERIACGLPVQCAGEIGWDLKEHKYYATNQSGHYRPDKKSLVEFSIHFFWTWGVDLDVRPFDFI